MDKILVIDDSIFCRELVAKALKHEGYDVLAAASGQEGLDLLTRHKVSLIILDNEMPQMDGLTFLRQMRRQPAWRDLPVIMLTGNSQKEKILTARQLGAGDYLLKSTFSVETLLSRMRKLLQSQCAIPAAAAPPQKSPASAARQTKQSVLDGFADMEHIKTLGGTVSRALAFADSPRSSLQDLATLIQQDPILSTRILQTANSAAFAGAQSRVKTVIEAVKKIGTGGVRTLVMSLGVFESFPAKSNGDLRCWQHGLAVATFMDRMLEGVAGVSPGSGHIVGLCHDLAEIFVRQRFPETFVCAADAAASAGVPIAKVFPDIFGMSYGDLTVEMMKWTQLPPEIARPIDQYHRLGSSGSDANPVVRALRIADLQASGLLLISSPQELVAPLLASEAKPPQCPPSAEAQRLRAEVLINFYMLSGVPMGKDSEFTRPLLPKSSAKILYIRPPEFSPCDPLENAMRLLGDVELVADPIAAKLAKFEGIVMACPAGAAASPLLASLRQLLEDGESVPTLLLGDRATLAANPTNKMREFPLLLSDLHQFIAGVKENRPLQPA